MDLLSRLIAGSAATSPTKQKLNTPTERLSACKRICAALQQIWRNGTRLSDDSAATKHVLTLLDRLNTILHDESRKAAPHSCLLYTATTQIYIIITKLALSSNNSSIISVATQFFHILINGEAEGVLDSKIFARALVDLVRRSSIFVTIVVDEHGEANLVELLFEIATKIRLDPDILPGWFYPERDPARNKVTGSEARRNQFPLFYLLVDYVHHDGPMGDFARTGLLYLTETASRSKALETWMIESDLAPQMASGLSALYSRLSRQGSVFGQHQKTLPIIALSDDPILDMGTEDNMEESQQNIRAFLSYLAFWQDTLNHCKSVEVRENLLDHFQVLFVQQLLYPSLLESSDVVGGSTSAVLLHLRRILEVVDHHQLLERMLQYLLASSTHEIKSSQSKHNRSRMSISRRKSMDALETLKQTANTPSPDLFNLSDLLVLGIHSENSQTVNASLKLVTMILRRHHRYVLQYLFKVDPVLEDNQEQSLYDYNEKLMKLLDLANEVAQIDTADESYDAALNDARFLLESHSCLLARCDESKVDSSHMLTQEMSVNCRLFRATLGLLRSFFANDAVTNVTLTETLVNLASCEHIMLRHWLFLGQNEIAEGTLGFWQMITELVHQVKQWRSQFPTWDTLFARQKVLLDGDADTIQSPAQLSSSGRSSFSSARRSPKLAPSNVPVTPVRASTPRGQKLPPPGFGSIDSTLAGSPKLGSSPAKALAGSPLYQSSFPGDVMDATSMRSASSAANNVDLTILKQQIALPKPARPHDHDQSFLQLAERLKLDETGSGTSTPKTNDLTSGTVTPSTLAENEPRQRVTASLEHIITNAIILQEFIFELTALLQVRGTMFDEVDLS